MKSFETWTLEDLETSFGLQQVDESIYLTNWISSTKLVNDFEKTTLEHLRIILKENVNTWNEDELKMHFIGPITILVNFITKKYKSFTQRTLKAKINEIDVSGKVDFMVAQGKQKPRTPFFFLHEYKPARRAVNDPDGQLLIELLTAQTLNNNHEPLYGIVVEGRLWYFIVLKDKEYAISNPFDACDVDIYQIYAILCKVKDYIEEILAK